MGKAIQVITWQEIQGIALALCKEHSFLNHPRLRIGEPHFPQGFQHNC